MGDSAGASRRLEALADIPVLPLNESVMKLSIVYDALLIHPTRHAIQHKHQVNGESYADIVCDF